MAATMTATKTKILEKRVRLIKEEITTHPTLQLDESIQEYLQKPNEELSQEIIAQLSASYLPIDTMVVAIMKGASISLSNTDLYYKIKAHLTEIYKILGKQY